MGRSESWPLLKYLTEDLEQDTIAYEPYSRRCEIQFEEQQYWLDSTKSQGKDFGTACCLSMDMLERRSNHSSHAWSGFVCPAHLLTDSGSQARTRATNDCLTRGCILSDVVGRYDREEPRNSQRRLHWKEKLRIGSACYRLACRFWFLLRCLRTERTAKKFPLCLDRRRTWEFSFALNLPSHPFSLVLHKQQHYLSAQRTMLSSSRWIIYDCLSSLRNLRNLFPYFKFAGRHISKIYIGKLFFELSINHLDRKHQKYHERRRRVDTYIRGEPGRRRQKILGMGIRGLEPSQEGIRLDARTRPSGFHGNAHPTGAGLANGGTSVQGREGVATCGGVAFRPSYL